MQNVADTVQRVTGLTLRRQIGERRAGDPPELVATNARAKARLGWRPQRSLDDAVRDAWTWMLSHPEGYGD